MENVILMLIFVELDKIEFLFLTKIKNQMNINIVNTEFIGMITEDIICKIINIKFNSTRSYEIPDYLINDINDSIKTNLEFLKIKEHTGNKNISFDFVNENNEYISIKTSISSSCMVCPQNIGQCTLKKLIKLTNIKNIDNILEYKTKVVKDPIELLEIYFNNLFCCKYTVYFKYITGQVFIFEKM